MKIESVERGTESAGKTQMLRYLRGQKVTRHQAMQAKCFECMGGYADGRVDCGLKECALYPWMPYKTKTA
jgi:hypothetical protein